MTNHTVTSLWQWATEARRETVWNALPEEIWHEVKEITETDIEWLIDTSALSENLWEAHAAYRALAIIAEDYPEHMEVVLDFMCRSLDSVSGYRRHWAAEAIWQIGEFPKEIKDLIEEKVEGESVPEVKATLEHVLKIINHL